MNKIGILSILLLSGILSSCNTKNSKANYEVQGVEHNESNSDTLTKHLKAFNPELPTLGLLKYQGVV